MGILITSKRDGFRRCGVEHSSTPTEYADDRWTPEDLAILEAEPMLVIQHVGEPEGVKQLADMTVAELKAYATEKGIDLGDATKRDDILAAITAAEAGKE